MHIYVYVYCTLHSIHIHKYKLKFMQCSEEYQNMKGLLFWSCYGAWITFNIRI